MSIQTVLGRILRRHVASPTLLCDPERLRVALIRARAERELQAYQVEEQRAVIERQLEELTARRRSLSVQREHRLISDAELLGASAI